MKYQLQEIASINLLKTVKMRASIQFPKSGTLNKVSGRYSKTGAYLSVGKIKAKSC